MYQKMRIPKWVSAFFNTLGGTRKGGRAKRGKKLSGGHFFSPWESPLICRRIRYGCGCESNILCKTIFLVCTRKRIPIRVSSFLFRPLGGKGLEHSNATVRGTVAHARLDGHDTSVFAHSRAKTQTSPFRCTISSVHNGFELWTLDFFLPLCMSRLLLW